jgi:nucleoside triphosphate diphosphatase
VRPFFYALSSLKYTMLPARTIDRLLDIMAALRTPKTGCPWDLEQNFASIAPYTLEEAYEVVDAIERNDMHDLCDELGDLLLQVVFHARMAQEQNSFDFGDVVEAITTKLIRRHPHVFGDISHLSADEVKHLWARIKADEKAHKREARRAAGVIESDHHSLLDDIPTTMPALTRAIKLQQKASHVGFDWNDPLLVLAKIREETDEIEKALNANAPQPEIAGEIGDLFFAVANLARHLHIDPEAATRQTNAKFTQRFTYIEHELARKYMSLQATDLETMDALWNEAKAKGL